MKRFYFLIVALSATILFTACSDNETKKAQVVEVQKASSSKQVVTLTTLEGTPLELSFSNNVLVSKDLNGKITIINFFATWCPPCIEEIPTFNKLYEEYGDILEIVGVLYEKDRNKEDILAFAEKYNIKFPITLGEENFAAAEMFDDVEKIPETFLFSKDGFLFEKYVGVIDEKVVGEYLLKNSKK